MKGAEHKIIKQRLPSAHPESVGRRGSLSLRALCRRRVGVLLSVYLCTAHIYMHTHHKHNTPVLSPYKQMPCAGTHQRAQRDRKTPWRTQRPAVPSHSAPFVFLVRTETSRRELMPLSIIAQTYVEIIGRFMRRTPAVCGCFSSLWRLILRK